MTQKRISVALFAILAIFAAKSAKFIAWFIALPVFWMVTVCMAAFFVLVMLVIRAFGGVDFLQLIGL